MVLYFDESFYEVDRVPKLQNFPPVIAPISDSVFDVGRHSLHYNDQCRRKIALIEYHEANKNGGRQNRDQSFFDTHPGLLPLRRVLPPPPGNVPPHHQSEEPVLEPVHLDELILSEKAVRIDLALVFSLLQTFFLFLCMIPVTFPLQNQVDLYFKH